MPGVARSVVDAAIRHGAEEREPVGRDVDRPAPGALDPSLVESGKKRAKPGFGPGGSRKVVGEATVQPAAAGAAGRSFSMSDNGTGRSRGSSGWLIPNAVHFSYQSMVDDAGNPDCYIYVETLAPENGVHPYNFDKLMGSFKTGKDVAQIIPDINMRVRRLEGVLRAGRASGS